MAEARIFALDISDHSIAGVRYTAGKQGPENLVAHFCPVSEAKPFGDALSEVIDACDAHSVRCFLSLSADKFHFRMLHVPFTDQKKVRSVVPFEIEDSVSFQEEPFLFDYLLQRPADENDGTDVFAVLVERQVIEHILGIMTEHGLDPEVITVSGIPAVHNLCRRQNGNRVSCALIQIDRIEANVFVVVDNELKVIRSLPFPLNGETDFDQPVDVTGNLEDALKRLAADIEHTLLAAQSVIPDDMKLILLFEGIVGSMPRTREIMSAQLDGNHGDGEWAGSIEVDKQNLHNDQFPRGSLDNAYALANCSARDRERINFRKGDFAFAGNLGRHLRLIKIGVAALIFLLAGLFVYETVDYRNKERKREALTERIETLYRETVTGSSPGPDPVKQLQVKVNELNEASATGTAHDPSLNTIKLLADVSARLPKSMEVSFERLIYDRKTVRIRGLTDNFNTVDQMKNSLAESPLFAEVTIGSANLAPKEKGVRFELKLQL